ncbi:MAG: hypothetical protein ACFHVJ_16300 [Aestuariibacter sp.]
MPLTSLQKATLGQLGISCWQANEDFIWNKSQDESAEKTPEIKNEEKPSALPVPPEAKQVVQSTPEVIQCEIGITPSNWDLLPEQTQNDITRVMQEMDVTLTVMTNPIEQYEAAVGIVNENEPDIIAVKKSLWNLLKTTR